MRIGFLGAGLIAQHHARMLARSGRDHAVVAVHDPDRARAGALAAETGASVAGSEEEVIATADAVYVCTWTSEHQRLVEAVVAAGRAVFCEKPLATDLAGAQAVVRAVESAGVVNQVGLVLRDSPAFGFLRHLVSEPRSGRVMAVVFRDDQYLPVQGMYGSDWRADSRRAGAGTLLEHSIHDLDLLEWIFGPVTTVSGRGHHFHELPGIEDAMVATLSWPGGATATLTSVWHDVLARPSQRWMEVLCERAVYRLESDLAGPVRWSRGDGTNDGDEGGLGGEELVSAVTERIGPVRNPDGAFVAAVADRTPATPGVAEALRPHLLVDAIYRSWAAGGVPVEVPPGRPG